MKSQILLKLVCISSLMSIYFCSEFRYDFKHENLCNRSTDLTVDSIYVNRIDKTSQLFMYCNREAGDYYKLIHNQRSDKYQVDWRRRVEYNFTPPVDVIFSSNNNAMLYIYNVMRDNLMIIMLNVII